MAARQKPYGGVYENYDFEKVYGPKPDHIIEYPKAIPTGPHGQFQVVQSAQEENDLLSKMQKDEDDAPAFQAPMVSDPAKDILISRCRELGIPFNAKWSKAKLEATVAQAEFDVDNLPPEMPRSKKHQPPATGYADAESQTHEDDDKVHETQDEIKDRLIAEAKSMGISANKLWGIPRLKAFIAEEKAKRKD